jgi:glutamate dehydrogenase/leucine dehydrogenase
VFAPCALGDEVTEDTVDRIQATIICGGANNQLKHPDLADALTQRGILFVPDFLANAGGLINVSDELEPDGYHRERVVARINELARLLETLYERAAKDNTSLSAEVAKFVALGSVA